MGAALGRVLPWARQLFAAKADAEGADSGRLGRLHPLQLGSNSFLGGGYGHTFGFGLLIFCQRFFHGFKRDIFVFSFPSFLLSFCLSFLSFHLSFSLALFLELSLALVSGKYWPHKMS